MKTARITAVLVLIACSLMLIAGMATAADKINVKGKIKSYDLDAKTVTVTADDGKEMTFTIKSDKALEKLDDRLFKGDEVKIRYTEEGGKMLLLDGNDLRGTKPGC